MPRLKLQVDTDVFELREVIRESGIEEGSEIGQIDVHFPEGCFIQTPAIALLTSWLLSKKSEGHTISLEGSQRAIGYLARMNFHRSLELEEPDHSRLPESGRFIPLMLVEDGESVFKAVNLIADTVLQQFDTASDFLPALEWAVNEIVDNVLIHSQTQSPGVVCAQLFENKERLKIAICDSGIGIYESLKGSYSIDDDDSAIEKALERGVTRDLKIGQGNGLAGSLEILSQNRGEFSLWSGKTIFHSNQDGERRFFKGHGIPGTGVSMSFNLSEPVSLGNTWIGERDYSYIDAEAERISEQGIVIKDVCSHTGSRPPATRLRRKILTILPEIEGSISLDFSGIKSFSSSFLDELLGRLNSELGVQKFNEKIVIKGLEDLHMNMANNVIGQRLESESGETNRTNAWLTRLGIGNPKSEDPGIKIIFDGEPELFQAIKEGDWILTIDENTEVVSVAEVLRKKQNLENTTLFFKKAECVNGSEKQVELEERCKTEGSIERIQWGDFERIVLKVTGRSFTKVPLIEDAVYVRELLQDSVRSDLLGPAGGPYEKIVGMSVRDRYLVGKLKPMRSEDGGLDKVESLEVESGEDLDEEPSELEVHEGRHEPGADFSKVTGKVDTEDFYDEIDTTNNQSLVPSSFGMTFCVDGEQEEILLDVSWGRYERIEDQEITISDKRKDPSKENKIKKLKVWERLPCGGKLKIPLESGPIKPLNVDSTNPGVIVQGNVREKNETGSRLVTVFLVNAQTEPFENKDTSWIFQPSIKVKSVREGLAIFRRRSLSRSQIEDMELQGLDMIYRKNVEFCVGHGVSVHASLKEGTSTEAFCVETEVMPEYEVPITETPGREPEDRSVLREINDKGFLDMLELSKMGRDDLIEKLKLLTEDYKNWIEEQKDRIGKDVTGFDDVAKFTIERCESIHERLEEGIKTLENPKDDKAFEAFRMANLVMANQRVRSIFALKRRRGEEVDISDLDIPKNRSWRPFQLAFILLSIPPLANPFHKDRTDPTEADADLLWFPTGGGKTEAYLGVAAFAMLIRRMQKMDGYDCSRGLTVIMRYTLRLLTLQQFQRASTMMCAMEMLRKEVDSNGEKKLGDHPFTLGLWVGNKVTPGTTQDAHDAIRNLNTETFFQSGTSSPAQLTNCPWCGHEIRATSSNIKVDKSLRRTSIFCGDPRSQCEFSKGKSYDNTHPGLPVNVVDEEIYLRPPSMMIATVDKFASMAWRGEVKNLFGNVNLECERHGLIGPESEVCKGSHPTQGNLPRVTPKTITRIRPPDLIIQDEFHLISGPLGTMVGLYETAVDELSTFGIGEKNVRPKVIASTATVRKAKEQMNNVFMRNVSIFPPSGLDVEDNFFSVQRYTKEFPGRRYLGVCSPGNSRPAILIRVYATFLTAAQELFNNFGPIADPYMTTVGYFNSLRELGGMNRLIEDDVRTRAFRTKMSPVERPGLAQRSVSNNKELTSRVSSQDIPKYLDELEIKFKGRYDASSNLFVSDWAKGESRALDVMLATNMLSVGVDVSRLGLMVVNGQPKGTAEYIQATSRVGREQPGLVCTVLTWARPRDLSHYETFENYHATFYKHVEAVSVTPFSPRALDRGLTGASVSLLRLKNDNLNPNTGAQNLTQPQTIEVTEVENTIKERVLSVTEDQSIEDLSSDMFKERIDEWCSESNQPRKLAYDKKGKDQDTTVGLLKKPGIAPWDKFTVPMSMREVEAEVGLIMNVLPESKDSHDWKTPTQKKDSKVEK